MRSYSANVRIAIRRIGNLSFARESARRFEERAAKCYGGDITRSGAPRSKEGKKRMKRSGGRDSQEHFSPGEGVQNRGPGPRERDDGKS